MGLLFGGLLVVLLLLGTPLFLLIGGSAVLCFVLFAGTGFSDLASSLLERIRSLADQQTLLAIPFFMLSGSIMARGDISQRLINWARALVGWVPGGLAVSGIGAFVVFAAITGSSTATLVAIGGLVYPALIKEEYSESFSIGLCTTSGSLGILIPPSIPMIIYALFNTTTKIEVEKLFLGGVGPGILIALCLSGYSMVYALRNKTPRYKFSWKELGVATRDGFWSLMLPVLILGGIYSGLFTAIESAAASAVYALIVEIYFHGGMGWRDVPKVFAETITLLGSFIVIIVMAMGLADFLTVEGIPEAAAAYITSKHLSANGFLIVINIMLLIVGCLMDVMSALMIFVPLIGPIAAAVGIDPIHLGIIFIVNLEIGYLTPPVGLNLILSASMFKKSFGQVTRYTAPFLILMVGALMVVTWVPKLTLGPLEWIYGYKPLTPDQVVPKKIDEPTPPKPDGKTKSLKDLMDETDAEEQKSEIKKEEPKKVKPLKDLMDESE
jgi:C4-dicarboxylate transporter DctM subunit